MGKKSYKKRLLDIRQDRLDLRGRVYQPILKSLPSTFPDSSYIEDVLKCYLEDEMILDQGKSGACSGFALASIINYLLWMKESHKKTKAKPMKLVSEKMLFNLARIYDEWDGEDYEGSSCRGAMKGWHKHGVCNQEFWEFKEDEPIDGWEKDSIEKPLGAYYRVQKDSIADMQSALCEVGALYVSASIHDGWWQLNNADKNIDKNLPLIPCEAFPEGNHAFIIVGYTRQGFIVQNSWGQGWGNCGFAVLSYRDWLVNGLDVWVAVMGVPIDIGETSHTITEHSLTSSLEKQEISLISEGEAYNHTLILNANGRAKHTMIKTFTVERSIEIVCYDNLKVWLKKDKKNRKVMIYALGGIDNEKEAIAKIKMFIPSFLNNGVYPIFLTWQFSYQEAIEESIEEFFKKPIEGQTEERKEKILKESTALDRAIERYCNKISTRAIWTEMKEQSYNSSQKKVKGYTSKSTGTLYLLTKFLKQLTDEFNHEIELHAMAHSAGSQLLTPSWLNELVKQNMKFSSMHLLAPTLSIQDSNTFMIKAHKNGLFEKKNIYIYDEQRDRT